MDERQTSKSFQAMYLPPLFAGAIAGLSVDVALYPLDTLKTRLQSAQGFQKAGGFNGVYRGLLTVATTSVPTASLFFVSYEATKISCLPLVTPQFAPVVHMFAASVGELLACLIRVPTEVAKQRKQTNASIKQRSSVSILLDAYKTEGLYRGVYRGFFSTVLRDLPFSFIELPVWELLKTTVKNYNNGEISGLQSAACGSIAGMFAAAVTTPLDLAKTRIMLAEANTDLQINKLRVTTILTQIYCTSGVRGLFAGVTPRMTAFMLGGFVFFGMYDFSKAILEKHMS